MKKQTLRRFTVFSFLLMLTAVTVSAQSERIRVINIPFSFTVGQKTLPAGEYTLEPNRKDSDNVWLLQSKEGHASALFTTNTVRTSETQEAARRLPPVRWSVLPLADLDTRRQHWTRASHDPVGT